MSWSVYSTIIIFNLIITISYLPLSIFYYYRIILPNKSLPIYRLRRPNFLFLFLLVFISNGVLRATLSLLTSVNIIYSSLFKILFQASTYYGSITIPCIRVWLLYNDIKVARKQREYMLTQYLTSIEDVSIKSKKSTHNYTNILSNYKSLLIISYTITTIFFAIDVILTMLGVKHRVVHFLFLFGTVTFWTFLMFSMWHCCNCCSKKKNTHTITKGSKSIALKESFRDDWHLLLELSLLWMLMLFGMIIGVALDIFGKEQAKPAFNSCITGVLQTANILITFYCPYSILKKLKFTKFNNKSRKTLKKILSKKSYFFAFVQHLVHELSMENLTFIVEVWQFKFEEQYDLTRMDREDMKKAELFRQKQLKWNKNNTHREDSKSIQSSQAISTTSQMVSSMVNSIGYNEENREIEQNFLKQLPWCELPLSQSLSLNPKDKWFQCIEIYNKFIGFDCDYAINIGYEATVQINNNYDRLIQYKQRNDNDNDIEEEVIDSIERKDKIMNDDEFKIVLMEVFDCTMTDILQNLNNSLDRFLVTDVYKMLDA